MGRPTQYKPEYAEIGLLLRSRGYTDRDIAAVLRVAASTLCGWQTHPEFLNPLPAKKRQAEIVSGTSALPVISASVPVEAVREEEEEERPPAKVCRLEGGRVYGTHSFERPKGPPPDGDSVIDLLTFNQWVAKEAQQL